MPGESHTMGPGTNLHSFMPLFWTQRFHYFILKVRAPIRHALYPLPYKNCDVVMVLVRFDLNSVNILMLI